jgi:hypothetical protein
MSPAIAGGSQEEAELMTSVFKMSPAIAGGSK